MTSGSTTTNLLQMKFNEEVKIYRAQELQSVDKGRKFYNKQVKE